MLVHLWRAYAYHNFGSPVCQLRLPESLSTTINPKLSTVMRSLSAGCRNTLYARARRTASCMITPLEPRRDTSIGHHMCIHGHTISTHRVLVSHECARSLRRLCFHVDGYQRVINPLEQHVTAGRLNDGRRVQNALDNCVWR